MRLRDLRNEICKIILDIKPGSYKFKLFFLMGLIIFLFVILGLISDIYMTKVVNSSEAIYRQTTEGTIEIGLMKEQLSDILTLYALGLNGKNDFYKVKNLDSNIISNIATLITIYPKDEVLSEISNQMIKAIRILESAERDGFNWQAMKELQTIDTIIQADLIKFKASKRLRWSSTIKSYENFFRSSQSIYLFILMICASLICGIGYMVLRSFQKTTPASVYANPLPTAEKQTFKKNNEIQLMNSLSDREKTILGLMAQGYDNREIAGRMYMAEQTIKNYVSDIYSKLGVHGRVQASLKAIEAGLIEVQEKN